MGNDCQSCEQCHVLDNYQSDRQQDLLTNQTIVNQPLLLINHDVETLKQTAQQNSELRSFTSPSRNKYFCRQENEENVKQTIPQGIKLEGNYKIRRERRKPYNYSTGAVYEGEWLLNLRDGYGMMIWNGILKQYYCKIQMVRFTRGIGNRIELTVKESFDMLKEICNQSARFQDEGEWILDKAEGYGIYQYFDGSKYEGYWKNDQQDGYGIEVWHDGSKYEGLYKNGSKHGFKIIFNQSQGKYCWLNSSIYIGQWFENTINGYGKYEWPDGRKYEGEWLKNNMHGKGVYQWMDGRKYVGDYSNDLKHGFGIYQWADGRRYEGHWAYGKQNGRGRYTQPDGIIKDGVWDNGHRMCWLNEDYLVQTTF